MYTGTRTGQYSQARGQGANVTTPSFTAMNLTRGTRYYFAVTAVDRAGNESGYSAEASKLIP